MQLVQLQQAQSKFRRHGLRVAAITYDSDAILKEFAALHKIDYSLMSDPHSDIIRSFGLLDPDESPSNLPEFAKKGIAFPGYFLVDRKGIVQEKYFGNAYYDRFTPNNVISKLFPELLETTGSPVATPHFELVTKQSDRDVVVGSRVTLGVEVRLPKGTHVYAQGVEKYKPTELVIESIDATPLNPKNLKASRYPKSKVLLLPAIKERVPIYEGRFIIGQDLVILPPKEVQQRLMAPDAKPGLSIPITVHGQLKYQACDAKICFLPTSVPIVWELIMHQNDFNRASQSIQEKRN